MIPVVNAETRRAVCAQKIPLSTSEKHNVPKCSHTTKIILVLFQNGIMQEVHTTAKEVVHNTVKEVVQNVFAELFLREMQENKGRPYVYRKQ